MVFSLSVHQHFTQAILKNRKIIRTSKFLIIATMISFGLNYYQLISHIFQKEDLTNLAIVQAIMSNDYKSNIYPIFDRLEKYNNGDSTIKPSSDFYASIPTLFNATIVHIHGKLKPIALEANNKTERTQFGYTPEYNITLTLSILAIFILIEIILFSFLIFIHYCIKSKHEINYENKVIDNYFDTITSTTAPEADEKSEICELKYILKKFNIFHIRLNQRYNCRTGFIINDEYDVQDLLYAILALHYQDIHRESSIPYKTGANSRIDFLIRDKSIGIEVKMTRDNLKDKEIGEQIIIDLHRYASHQNCKDVIFFVYDPKHLIRNVNGLQSDIKNIIDGITPHLIVVPEH